MVATETPPMSSDTYTTLKPQHSTVMWSRLIYDVTPEKAQWRTLMNTVTAVISITTWNNRDPGCDNTLTGDMYPQARKVMDLEFL